MTRKVKPLFIWLLFQKCLCVSIARDASEITWTQEADSIELLKTAVKTNVNMLVVDVTIGPTPGTEGDPMNEPVPLIGSRMSRGGITLESWLDALLESDKDGRHGIKLKFQDPDAITPALKALRKRDRSINFPIWVHGDVLDGPVNTTSALVIAPVAGDYLLKQTQLLVPTATVSLGWATAYLRGSNAYIISTYSWKDVADMATICRCSRSGSNPKVSFAVRSVFVGDSMDTLRWLLDAVPSSTLSIWSSIHDMVNVNDLLRLRGSFPFSKIYYELPRYAEEEFRRRKGSVSEPSGSSGTVTMTTDNWVVFPYNPDCKTQPFITQDAIVIPYLTEPITFLLNDWYELPVTVHGILVPYNLHHKHHVKTYQASSMTVFYSSDSSVRSTVAADMQATRRAMTYTATLPRMFSNCTVDFLVRISQNGVVCSVQDNCEDRSRTQDGSSISSDCNAYGSVGGGPINVGLSFQGWRGWVVHNFTVIHTNGGPVLTHSWNLILFVSIFLMSIW